MSNEAIVRSDAALGAAAKWGESYGAETVRVEVKVSDLRTYVDHQRSLIPEPPTDDEREALAADVRFVDGKHDLGAGALADALYALGWRNRHRGPITAGAVERAAIALYDQVPIRYALTWSEHERAGEVKPWTALGESTRRTYRHRAQLLLEAAEAAR